MRRIVAPILILGVGAILVATLYATRPVVETRPIELPLPVVRAEQVVPSPYHFRVETQGTVMPRTQSDLVSQVSGEVEWVSPELVPGGFFEAGQSLLRLDPIDYEAELESARASMARAESEDRRARKELDRQRRLAGRSVASQARIDDAENASRISAAGLREAVARLGRAERDLERTEIRAPYAGRVRSENVDPGQFVQRGVVLGRIYAVDYAEVRLPVPDRELRFLELPLRYRGDPVSSAEAGVDEASPVSSAPAVVLRAEFAGRMHEWPGRIVRTEGEIDARSRMVTVVARVEDPYGPGGAETGRPPLAVGLFVSATIEGVRVPHAVLLPRAALRGDGQVFVVDGEDRLRLREVEVLRVEREQVVIGGGIGAGERVCVSPIPSGTDGMAVAVQMARPQLAGRGGS